MGAKFIAAFIIAPYLALAIALFAAPPPARHSAAYTSGVNAALNETLVVGAEWTALRVNFTWEQLQSEVARRLGVVRNEPWRSHK